jgi:hypothetical protein
MAASKAKEPVSAYKFMDLYFVFDGHIFCYLDPGNKLYLYDKKYKSKSFVPNICIAAWT